MIQSLGFITPLKSFPSAYLAFVLGRTLRKYEKNMNSIYSIKGATLSFGVLLILNQIGRIEMSSGIITNVLFYQLSSICGWILLMTFSRALCRSRWRKTLYYLGDHTMAIMLFHFMAFKIVTYFYLQFRGYNIKQLSLFPVLNEGCLWIPYTIVGVVVPLTVSAISDYLMGKSCKEEKSVMVSIGDEEK